MIAQAADTYIPIYTHEQSSQSGSPHFEIARNCGLTPLQRDLFFVPHRKDYYLLAFARAGTSRHWLDMVPYSIQPDTLYFSSPQPVFLKEDGAFEAIAITFTQEFLEMEEGGAMKHLPIIQNPHKGHELRLAPADVAFVDDITAKMLAEYGQRQGWQAGMLSAYMRVLLIYLSRLYTEQYAAGDAAADRELLTRFLALVSDNFAQAHEVAAYAQMLHLSPGHFSEQIKKQSGKTAIEHIHDRLLLEAKRLLFHTDHSMKEIAYRLGFEEASYFNRFFKRLTEQTPLSYRSTIREMYH